ncbi:hypothetical protein [Archangium sp.]|uniref:hypothetical protein n=1 Tax=Archangium sp. TaxID=1872627 RepID=UPI002ED8ADC9
MKWRLALGVGAALLLLLPLTMLLSRPLRPAPSTGRHVLPMLDAAERRGLETYTRPCKHSSDCEPPLRCVRNPQAFISTCSDSECLSDSHCGDRRVCRDVDLADDGSLVRVCVLQGTRVEGERCDKFPTRVAEACGPGLLCGGREGWCGRPCQKNVAKDCQEGFFCADVVPQPLCLPSCEARGCPAGQHCIRFKEGASACVEVYGKNCQSAPCPENEVCKVRDAFTAPGKAWMECVRECVMGGPATCPEGSRCFVAGYCLPPPCDPSDPNACAAGFRCEQKHPAIPGQCQPEWAPAP